jgi:UDP-glucuronate decarboxylase
MRILVTGAAGFLGSHLCDALLLDGHDVIGMDNFFTGSRENLSQLRQNAHFELIRHDVVDPIIIEGVERIYHAACPASPVHYQANSVRTMRTAAVGTMNMLDMARELRARFMLFSTSEIYGDPQVSPQREDYWGNVNLRGPRACYDEGKRVGEAMTVSFAHQFAVDTRTARIFNTHGPRMAENDGRVVSNFILQALKGEPLTIYGDGSQTRSLCYVSDLIDGLVRLMNTSCDPGPVNLGNPTEITMLTLARTIIGLTGSKSDIVHKPLPVDDPTRRCPDITKAGEVLNWVPQIDLVEGLRRTINYFYGRRTR